MRRRVDARIPGGRARIAAVAMNMVPTGGPWGGGNQWLRQMVPFLRRHGYAVSFDLRTPVDAIVMIDPRVGGLVTFGPDDIRSYKARHPRVRCLHRINECDKRKGTADMDKRLADANAVADYTVFVSRWLRDYHAERWFDRDRPHMAIYNGADPSVFHPIGGAVFPGTGPLRLVTHHWSNNWNKGFGEYQEVDRLIASGALPDLEFWFIGRAPSAVRWAAARTFDPMPSARVAARLRECHMYLTASQWEPGSMHHVEAAQCGLPVIYHENGGGIVESARTYGVAFRDDVAAAIACARADYPALRRRVLAQAPSGAEMASAYLRIIQRLVAGEPS